MEFLLLWVLSGNILDSGMRYEDAGSCYADAQNSGMELRERADPSKIYMCCSGQGEGP